MNKEFEIRCVSLIGVDKDGIWSATQVIDEDLSRLIRAQFGYLTLTPSEEFPDYQTRTYQEAFIPLVEFHKHTHRPSFLERQVEELNLPRSVEIENLIG